jgi:lipopolysaccharide transport system permease protein
VIPLATQIWFYATPVIYPLSAVTEEWRGIYKLNPMVGIIDAYRRVLALGRPPDMALLATSAIIAAAALVAGFAFFKRSERQFADLI